MSKVASREDFLRRRTLQSDIPELGRVTLESLTIGDVLDAEKVSTDSSGARDHGLFANYILSKMVTAPALSMGQIKVLSGATLSSLLEAAAELMGVRKEFNELDSDIVGRERLYQACNQHMVRLASSLQDAANRVVQQFEAMTNLASKMAVPKDIFSAEIFSRAPVFGFSLKPFLFDSLKTSGFNSATIHTPTYSLPDVDTTSTWRPGEKEEAERSVLLDSFDILMQLERSLRQLIEYELRALHDGPWWKRGVPGAVRKSCAERKQEKESAAGEQYHPINYCYFNDYKDIILTRDNWQKAFEAVFSSKVRLEACFSWVSEARSPVAHARTLTEESYLELVFGAHWLQGRINEWLRRQDGE